MVYKDLSALNLEDLHMKAGNEINQALEKKSSNFLKGAYNPNLYAIAKMLLLLKDI